MYIYIDFEWLDSIYIYSSREIWPCCASSSLILNSSFEVIHFYSFISFTIPTFISMFDFTYWILCFLSLTFKFINIYIYMIVCIFFLSYYISFFYISIEFFELQYMVLLAWVYWFLLSYCHVCHSMSYSMWILIYSSINLWQNSYRNLIITQSHIHMYRNIYLHHIIEIRII